LKTYLPTLPNKTYGIIYEVEITSSSLKLNVKVILYQNSKTKIINFSISGFENQSTTSLLETTYNDFVKIIPNNSDIVIDQSSKYNQEDISKLLIIMI